MARIRSASFTHGVPDVETLDLVDIHPDFCGFRNGFTYGQFGYLVPYKNANGFSGKVVRIDLNAFDLETVVMVDLTSIHDDLRGFAGAFTHRHYAYFVPYQADHERSGDTTTESSFSGLKTLKP